MERNVSHPGETQKDVGLGLTLPLYISGPSSVSWWAMFITMLAILAAFASLVFGYFFYWTIHEDFPPSPRRARECSGPRWQRHCCWGPGR